MTADPAPTEYGLRDPAGHDHWTWTTETGARLAAASRPGSVVVRREWTCTVTLVPDQRTDAT